MRLRDSLARLGACALLGLAGLAGTAHAAGTLAGTDINNAAKLTYSVGGVTQGEICSSPSGNSNSTCENTTFKVDNKINLKVTTQETSAVIAVPGGTGTMTFIVSNDGNSAQGFSFTTITNLASGSVGTMFGGTGSVTDNFDPSSCTIYNSTNLTAAITSVNSVNPDGSVTLKVVCAVPLARVNADIAAVALRATATAVGGAALSQSSTNLPGDVDVVFADVAGPNDGVRDAAHSARHAVRVNTAAVQVAKTFTTICDPAGGAPSTTPAYAPKSIPGAYVQYTVTITNAGSAPVSAFLTNLADALDTTNVKFDGELITGANVLGVPACAATTVSPNGGTATSSGNAFMVTWTGGARTSFPGGVKYLPATGNYTAPNISVNWTNVLPIENGYLQAAELAPGDKVTLTYNVIIN